MDAPILTPGEVLAINRARAALKVAIERAGFPHHYGRARTRAALEHAGDGLFGALNEAASYCGLELSHEQIHEPERFAIAEAGEADAGPVRPLRPEGDS